MSSAAAASPRKADVFRVAVYLPFAVQLLDFACVDLFTIASRNYITNLLGGLVELPTEALARTPNVELVFVSAEKDAGPVECFGGIKVVRTHDITDPAVGPGTLDAVVIPGPNPRGGPYGEELLGWLRAQAADDKTDILSVCSAILVCAQAGLIKDKEIAQPRGMPAEAQQMFSSQGARLIGDTYRWTRDGNFWSCGQITNGIDLVSEYLRQNERFPDEIVDLALRLADVGERKREYPPVAAVKARSGAWDKVV